jgi:transposase
LWGAFTDRHAVFAIAASRHEEHACALLDDSKAVVTSDHRCAYGHLPTARRQVCWSHLQHQTRISAGSSR